MSEPASLMGQSPVISSNLAEVSDKTGLLNGVSPVIPPSLTESKSERCEEEEEEGGQQGEGDNKMEEESGQCEPQVPFETTL